MKNIFFFSAIIFSIGSSNAQEISPQKLQDSVIGWMKVYHFKGVKEPLKVDAKNYSAAQLSIADSLANWIQASYIPKGGLGDVKKSVSEKLNDYNQHTAALPPSYGSYATTYVFLKYNSSHKLVPANNLGTSWTIMANAVPSGWEIPDLSSPQQCYFTLPSFEHSQDPESVKKIYDLTQTPNLKPYISFWVKNPEAGNGTNYVLLCKDNKSPFIKLTKGEYLELLDISIPNVYQREKKKIHEANLGNQKSIDNFMKYLDEKNEKRKASLKSIKEKYKDRLEETALTNAQPSVQDLDNGRDVFSNGYLTDPESTSGRVPVYKIDPAMAELCKTNHPQWILISWWWAPNNPVENYMHESIINNFNFAYVYDFFFDPEKVKGQPYKPLRSPSFRKAVTVNEASEESKKNSADQNTFFFEDFSTTTVGEEPIGWKSKLNSDGKRCTITTLEGEKGNWVEIKGNEALVPVQLKKPLPQNFILSFDVAVPQNFTWGGKSLAFTLSRQKADQSDEAFISLIMRPSFDSRAGSARIETKLPEGYTKGSSFDAPGFGNSKKINRITVTFKKMDETLQIFIDKSKVADYDKAIPSSLLFNAMSFTHGRSDSETEKYFIRNIKITKN